MLAPLAGTGRTELGDRALLPGECAMRSGDWVGHMSGGALAARWRRVAGGQAGRYREGPWAPGTGCAPNRDCHTPNC